MIKRFSSLFFIGFVALTTLFAQSDVDHSQKNLLSIELPSSAAWDYLWSFDLSQNTKWQYVTEPLGSRAQVSYAEFDISLLSRISTLFLGKQAPTTNAVTRLTLASQFISNTFKQRNSNQVSTIETYLMQNRNIDGYVKLSSDEDPNYHLVMVTTSLYSILLEGRGPKADIDAQVNHFIESIELNAI